MAGQRYQEELSGSDQMLNEKPAGKVVFFNTGDKERYIELKVA